MTPADLYRDCRVSAWRVEALQHYIVPGDEERQRVFHREGRLLPPRKGKLDDLAVIRRLRDAGRDVGRVHVVDRPLSGYVRYEMAVYGENVSAGEDVRIADRSVHPQLAVVTEDFVIFDWDTPGAAVILFDYDEGGLVHGYQVITRRRDISHYGEMLEMALAYSIPLSEFTAATATG